MLVFEKRRKLEYPENTSQSKDRTNNKLNPHMTPCPGIEPGPHWWEASALTTAPPLLAKHMYPITLTCSTVKVNQNECVECRFVLYFSKASEEIGDAGALDEMRSTSGSNPPPPPPLPPGVIPPPPPLMMDGNPGRALAVQSRVKLRPFFWNKVPAQLVIQLLEICY